MSGRQGKSRSSARTPQPSRPSGPRAPSRGPAGARSSERRIAGLPAGLVIGLIGLVAVLVVAVGGVALLSRGGAGPSASPSDRIVAGNGGHWTNVTPNRLADMLGHKDFTLVNVKTPYIGEIAGTDLYIPYDQLAARRSQLPADRAARILVYCRSGAESAVAAQTLLDLGYTNVWNLDGGMNAWQASGRSLVNLNRQ